MNSSQWASQICPRKPGEEVMNNKKSIMMTMHRKRKRKKMRMRKMKTVKRLAIILLKLPIIHKLSIKDNKSLHNKN
jgi:hypothetical protein